jgi:type II restriction enzyme
MVNGFNALFGDRKKLGSWESYLAMREAILRVNAEPEVRGRLSKDLGAFAGLLYEVGTGRLIVPGNADAVLQAARLQADKAARLRHKEVLAEAQEETEHAHMQYLLIKIGRALNFDVYVARNDRHRSCEGQSFVLLTVPGLPTYGWSAEVAETVRLIDVIWLRPGTGEIVSAFEVEKSTSIYSGILRMQDLARSIPRCACHFYLVAPARRENEVMAQLTRPSFHDSLSRLSFAFISFEELNQHCAGLCTFGVDHTVMRKIARQPNS